MLKVVFVVVVFFLGGKVSFALCPVLMGDFADRRTAEPPS